MLSWSVIEQRAYPIRIAAAVVAGLYRVLGIVPDLATYLQRREYSVGMPWLYDLATLGLPPPAGHRARQPLHAHPAPPGTLSSRPRACDSS